MVKTLFLFVLLQGAALSADTVQVRPRATDELLANPGMGWQTFHRFANEDRNLQGLPSSSAYFRFYWREVEPREGEIDFAMFDRLLARARAAGQKLAFRIMTTGSGEYLDVPAWLKEKGCKGTEFTFEGRDHWVPDFDDPIFWNAHLRLIRELGRRYDGHPDMDLLDIGTVGLWGEWHMSGTKAKSGGKEVPLPSVPKRLAIIDAWSQAFPNTSKVILIGSDEGMALAAKHGYGWRADCLGDMGGFSKGWNHMEHFYLQQLRKTGAEEAWKAAPVAYESCWDMRKWKSAGWDIDFIFDYALRTHASYMNNKSAPIPEGARPQIERFLRKLGYRLVIASLEHPAAVQRQSALELKVDWENEGAAPPCRDALVAVRLVRAGAEPVVIVSGESIRGWLPGRRQSALQLPLPAALPPGEYELAIGLVGAQSKTPEVRMPLEGREASGWHALSRLVVQ